MALKWSASSIATASGRAWRSARIDLVAQHLLDVAPVEHARQRVVRGLLQEVLARLPLRGDVDDRRQQRVLAGDSAGAGPTATPRIAAPCSSHLRLEVVDAPVAEDVLQVACRARRGHPVLGRVPPDDLVQRHVEHRAPPAGSPSSTVLSAIRVSTIATGEKSTSARRFASLSCRSRVRSATFVSSASRSTRSASSRLVPRSGLQHHRDEVRERAGEQLLVQLPAPRPAGVLVTDDADHLAAQEHRRVEHRRDAERLEVALAKFAGARVGARVVGADGALALQRLEVARARRRRGCERRCCAAAATARRDRCIRSPRRCRPGARRWRARPPAPPPRSP